MQNRFSPVSVWLKHLVQSGILGEIYMVQVNCFWNRDERYYTTGSWHGTANLDGGTLYTQFSHFIDMVYWLFGDFSNIHARFNNFSHGSMIDFEDSGLINFDFKSGGTGNMNFSTSVWGSNLESTLTVIAENGSVKIGGQYMDKVEACHIKDYTYEPLQRSDKNSHNNHAKLIKEVTDTLKNNKKPEYAAAAEGVKVIELIESIYDAGRNSSRENLQPLESLVKSV